MEETMYMTRWGETMRLPVLLLTAGLMWLGAAAPLASQTAKEGTRVRVTAPEHMEQPCIGRVVSAADPLVVREKDGTMHYIPTRQVELLEVARRRNLSPETYLSTLLGMVAGGAIGYATYRQPPPSEGCSWTDPDYPDSCPYEPLPAWGRAVIGGIAGAAGGGLVGVAITPERWQPVWQREVGATIALARSGLGLRVDLPTR
jgi:hypothetical protein